MIKMKMKTDFIPGNRANSWRKTLCILCVLCCSLVAFAQQRVSGTVVDSNGEPIIGASVVEKGTTNGVVTDIDGKFSLNVNTGKTLAISYVGYKAVDVAAAANLSVVLEEDVLLLDDVVVIGYGTMEKKQVTSSITTISARELPQGLGGATIANSLNGKVSSLVMQETPSPNSDLKLQLRGMASVNAASGPLVVIDGMPGGDIRSVVQEDIQSIDILKDASGGAIYGSRATGGVILITTKQAQEGKLKLTYTGEVIFKNTFGKPRVMTADEYVQYKGSGYDFGGKYDWYDASLSDNPTSHRHVINLNGGSRDARIFATAMYEDNRGTMFGDNRKDFSGRVNGAFKLLEGWLDINTHITYRQADRNRDKATAGSPYFYNPTQNPEAGYPSADWPETVSMVAARNPLYDAKNITDKGLDKWFRPDVELKLNILPVEGLAYVQTFGYENRQWERKLYEPSYLQRGEATNRSSKGTAQIEFDKTDQVNSEGYFTFIRSIGEDHSINVAAGYSYFEKNREKYHMKNYGFDFDPVNVWNIGSGSYLNNPNVSDPKPEMKSQKAVTERLLAGFGRVNYSFRNKYMATATVRREGSSKFAEDNRWGTFYGLSAAWRLTEEGFLKDVKPINDLKLRFSYGVTGNEGVINDDSGFPIAYGTVSYTPSDNRTMLPDGSWVSSYGTAYDINPNLGWEEKHEWNIGLDYELLDRRIFGKIDFFSRNIEGLIFQTNNSKGQHGTWYENIGTLENIGWEFEIGGLIVNNKDWKYISKINVSHNSTKVGVMDGTSNKVYDGYVGRAGNVHCLEEDVQVGSFHLYKFAGFQTNERGLNCFTATLPDGTVKILDGDIDASEMQYMGNYVPKAVIGWSHDLQYKNWYLQMQINSAIDFDIYNAFEHVNGLVGGGAGGSQNTLLVAYTKNAGITGPAQITDYFLEDGTYVKIQNLSIGYNLGLKKYSRLFDSAKVYLSVNNALRLSKYSGSDPEIDFTGWKGGIDNGTSYPQTRSFALGVQFTF
jgi:TonB-linked SusC/RagA family outer membrane protein